MIVQEVIGNGLVRTYSDQRLMIRGGVPEGIYEEAIDPISAHRMYVETDIPIPEPEGQTEYLQPDLPLYSEDSGLAVE